MKKLPIFLISLFIAFTVNAQRNSVNKVTITVYGNNNLHLTIDNKDYNIYNSVISGNRTTFSVGDLERGQHSFQVTRTEQSFTRQERISSIFNLRQGFDMTIRVNTDGSLELLEKKLSRFPVNHAPMNYSNHNILMNNVRNQRTISGKSTLILDAFNTTNNYFTCQQVVQLLQLLNGDNYRLELAKSSYHTITDPANFNQVHNLLSSQASRNELDDYVNNYSYSNEEYNPGLPVSGTGFENLYQNVQQQWSVSDKVNTLTNAFNDPNNYFTSYQASRLIELVTGETYRLQLAKLSYHRINDPGNFNQVFDLLTTQSAKNQLTAYINNDNPGYYPNAAMSEGSFNSLYQAILMQFFPGERMTSLTYAFNKTGNYFSTAQAKQLIELVTAESNRLQLAKLSYRTIADRENFTQLYDLFENQANKDELDAYIRGIRD